MLAPRWISVSATSKRRSFKTPFCHQSSSGATTTTALECSSTIASTRLRIVSTKTLWKFILLTVVSPRERWTRNTPKGTLPPSASNDPNGCLIFTQEDDPEWVKKSSVLGTPEGLLSPI